MFFLFVCLFVCLFVVCLFVCLFVVVVSCGEARILFCSRLAYSVGVVVLFCVVAVPVPVGTERLRSNWSSQSPCMDAGTFFFLTPTLTACRNKTATTFESVVSHTLLYFAHTFTLFVVLSFVSDVDSVAMA